MADPWRRGGWLGHASISAGKAVAAASPWVVAAVLLRVVAPSRRRLASASSPTSSRAFRVGRNMLTNLGNLGYKPERWKIDEIGGYPYKVADAKGVGGMKGGAMLAAGAMLVMDGLRRGGKLGVAEDAGGGALIGFKYGGPLGALIGGIAGAVAGVVRLYIKGATEKTKDKIKALYGVDISDKGVLKQIVDMTKSSSVATSTWRSARPRSAT